MHFFKFKQDNPEKNVNELNALKRGSFQVKNPQSQLYVVYLKHTFNKLTQKKLKSKGWASIFMHLPLREPTQSRVDIWKNYRIYTAADGQQSTPYQRHPQFCIHSNLFNLFLQFLKYLVAEAFKRYS